MIKIIPIIINTFARLTPFPLTSILANNSIAPTMMKIAATTNNPSLYICLVLYSSITQNRTKWMYF